MDKGVGKGWMVDVLVELFEAVVHQILYSRGVYPKSVF
jgi:hypothetical protein